MTKRRFYISGRDLSQYRPYRSIRKICKDSGICKIDDIQGVFGSVKAFSPLYGGRVYNEKESLTYRNVDRLARKGINLMLTLSNHYYSIEKYNETIPILERLHRKGNSITITNDELAKQIRQDFPLYDLKASVVKFIRTYDEINKALEIYDYVTLDPKLNFNEAFLQGIQDKDRIILFASIRCVIHCENSICYPWVSTNMTRDNNITQSMAPCTNAHRKREVKKLTIFDLNESRYDGFSLFKIMPTLKRRVPN